MKEKELFDAVDAGDFKRFQKLLNKRFWFSYVYDLNVEYNNQNLFEKTSEAGERYMRALLRAHLKRDNEFAQSGGVAVLQKAFATQNTPLVQFLIGAGMSYDLGNVLRDVVDKGNIPLAVFFAKKMKSALLNDWEETNLKLFVNSVVSHHSQGYDVDMARAVIGTGLPVSKYVDMNNVIEGPDELVLMLLDIWVNIRPDTGGQYANLYSKAKTSVVAQRLYELGLRPDERPEGFDKTAIMETHWPDVYEFLKDNGANMAALDGNGNTVSAHVALKPMVLKRALEMGMNQNAIANAQTGTDIVMVAAQSSSRSLAVLIRADAALDTCDNKGQTPMHYAVESPDSLVNIQLLATAGCSIDTPDYNNVTPKQLAMDCTYLLGIRDVYDLLCDYEDKLHRGEPFIKITRKDIVVPSVEGRVNT